MADNLIFISYSHKDSDFVKKAIAEFESQNYNVWYDAGLEGGSPYNNEIATQIRNCDCFIAFMSNNYAVSTYCTTELEYALKRKKEILVAYIDAINEEDLPAGIEMHISRLQAIFRRNFATDDEFIKKICSEPIVTKHKTDSFLLQHTSQKTYSKEEKGIQVLNDYKGKYIQLNGKVYLNEILYIAIESKKSVLYLIDRKIETYYLIDYWKNLIDSKIFAQPHYAYIVNLTYVYQVTDSSVMLRYGDAEYSIYTSVRKIVAFKKAFLSFKNKSF